MRSGSEARSPAPAFGPCPVIRPVTRLAQVFTLLVFRSPPGAGLAAATCPPPAKSVHPRNRRCWAWAGRPLLTLGTARHGSSIRSALPCPARPKPVGLNGGPILTQGPVTEPAPRSACQEGAARGVCHLEWEFRCHVDARGHLNHVQRQPVRLVAGGTAQSRHWHSVEGPRSQSGASPAALV